MFDIGDPHTYIDPDSIKHFPAGTEGQNAVMNHIKVQITYQKCTLIQTEC